MTKPTHPKDMRDLDARQQLLVILMEECGELIQACSKCLRRGELFQYSDSESELIKEAGDVYTMLDLLHEWDVVSWNDIEERRDVKRQKLSRWSDLITPEEARKYVTEKAEKNLRRGYEAGIDWDNGDGGELYD